MAHEHGSDFSKKHAPGIQADPAIAAEINKRTKEEKVPCAVAFDIAKQCNAPVEDVGMAIDLANYRITRCQLGLFGYGAEKQIPPPPDVVVPELAALITEGLENQRLPCKTAWEIAHRLGLPKLAISSACEALEIKIKPCQLGAF